MKWIELLRKDNYALLQSESDTQYAVVGCMEIIFAIGMIRN